MKKILLAFACLLFTHSLKAQIVYDATYNSSSPIYLTKLQVSGYKYVKRSGSTLELYNINHSVFKTITIPPVFGAIQNIFFVSETLFDTDNLVEYAVQSYSASSTNKYRAYIFKENGTQLLMRDSAVISAGDQNIFQNQNSIYFDGTNTKMKLLIYNAGVVALAIQRTEIYTLPGTMPCSECSSGTVTGISAPSGGSGNGGSAVFYPNPVTDQLKLKYELPGGTQNAQINIYDLQGKLIETVKVTDTFDFIYLPSDYNNGMYLYTLVVDGKPIKTEKVILNK